MGSQDVARGASAHRALTLCAAATRRRLHDLGDADQRRLGGIRARSPVQVPCETYGYIHGYGDRLPEEHVPVLGVFWLIERRRLSGRGDVTKALFGQKYRGNEL